jgi:hypothetical protein
MEPKVTMSYVGVFLIVVGVLLIAAQMVLGFLHPDMIAGWSKSFDADLSHVKFQTNVLGFGVMVAGVLLLGVSSMGRSRPRPPHSN